MNADLVRRHPIAAYFILTCAFSWTLWKAVDRWYLAGRIEAVPIIMLGIFGPGLVSIWLSATAAPDSGPAREGRAFTGAFVLTWMPAALLITLDQTLNEHRPLSALTVLVAGVSALMPAFVVACALGGRRSVSEHLASLVVPRGAAGYYVVALFLFVCLLALGSVVSLALGLPINPRTLPPSAARLGAGGAAALSFCYTLIPNGLSEEVGWRGFALPRLQARHSPLAASLVVWVFWAAWHLPAYLGGFVPQSPLDTLVECLFMLPVALLLTWLYNRTQGSLAAVALFHASMNTAVKFLPMTLPSLALLLLLAVSVVVLDRMWVRRASAGGRLSAEPSEPRA